MLPGNQLAMGIQSKSVRAVWSVRRKAPHEPGVLGGRAPLTYEILELFFFFTKFAEISFSDFFPFY